MDAIQHAEQVLSGPHQRRRVLRRTRQGQGQSGSQLRPARTDARLPVAGLRGTIPHGRRRSGAATAPPRCLSDDPLYQEPGRNRHIAPLEGPADRSGIYPPDGPGLGDCRRRRGTPVGRLRGAPPDAGKCVRRPGGETGRAQPGWQGRTCPRRARRTAQSGRNHASQVHPIAESEGRPCLRHQKQTCQRRYRRPRYCGAIAQRSAFRQGQRHPEGWRRRRPETGCRNAQWRKGRDPRRRLHRQHAGQIQHQVQE